MKNRGFCLIISALWGAVCALAYLFNLFGPIDTTAMDTVYQRRYGASPNIHVIGIDEYTVEQLGPIAEWSRRGTAALIRLLNADAQKKPAVIAVDILFASALDEESDAELAAACREGGNVVMASSAVVYEEEGGYYIDDVLTPYPALAKASLSGHINAELDEDGVMRRMLYKLDMGGETSYLLGAAAAREYARKTGAPVYEPITDELGWFTLKFSGEPGDYYGGSGRKLGNSFARVLSGEIDPAGFAGDIVLIGPYAPGMQDAYITPIDKNNPMNGVEIHANVADALLLNRFFADVPTLAQAALLFIFTSATLYVFLRAGIAKSTAAFAAGAVVIAGSVYVCALWGVRLSVVYAPIGLCGGYLACLVINYARERKRRARITGTFKKYVAPSVVDAILREGGDVALSNNRRDIAAMFMDVRGFTSLSEKLEPEEIVGILNDYFRMITNVAFENGGTIDKFIGDAALVLFNAPFDQPDYELKAVRAGLAIVKGAAGLSAALKPRLGRDVLLGVGINCGPAFVGNLGTENRMDYTAIGDMVNTASRLESAAGPGWVVISAEMARRLSGLVETESIGELELKGKSEKIICYRVTGIVGEP